MGMSSALFSCGSTMCEPPWCWSGENRQVFLKIGADERKVSWWIRQLQLCITEKSMMMHSQLCINDILILDLLTRWFKVTFLSPSWRLLNPLQGSLNHPKKVTLNHLGLMCAYCCQHGNQLPSCEYVCNSQKSFLQQHNIQDYDSG